jgi:hemerythrin-like domain-containing protein
MTKVLESLRREHDSIVHVLDVLDSEVAYLAEYPKAERPDFDLVWRAIEFFTEFPDRVHHPKEDMIFERLRQVDPAAARQVGDLPGAHKVLAHELSVLSRELSAVMEDPARPHGDLTARARDFVRHQRQHLEQEEALFFPVADSKLSAADWAALHDRMVAGVDPLLDGEAYERFEALRRVIVNGLAAKQQAASNSR